MFASDVADDLGISTIQLLLGLAVVLGSIWTTTKIVYNLYFHPLRKFPGPLASRASVLPWVYQQWTGVQSFRTQRLHDKYGPVVRIAPGHLSFSDAQAFKDIYGHHVGSKSNLPEMPKAEEFARAIDAIPRNIINESREQHGRLRRGLAHGFSDASIREQEPVIAKQIDLLVQRLHENCDGGKTPLQAEKWYNWTTFDVAGLLVFGVAFKALNDMNSPSHEYIQKLMDSIPWGTRLLCLSRMGFRWLVQVLFRFADQMPIRKARQYTSDMVEHRLGLGSRNDLFEGLVKNRDALGLDQEKLASNAFVLVLAGSETTATTLSGTTYLLLEHRDILHRVTEEVRSSFKSVDEITYSSVSKLTYMLAVLNEALRHYPPVTSGLVRQVPPGGAQIAGHFVPAGAVVEVQHYSVNHSKDNWVDPFTFNPDRFLVDKEATGGKASGNLNKLEALQPFSLGPRNCIGRNLAYAEMRLILARILYDFDLRLDDSSKGWIERQKSFSLWKRLPLNVYFTPRAKKN